MSPRLYIRARAIMTRSVFHSRSPPFARNDFRAKGGEREWKAGIGHVTVFRRALPVGLCRAKRF